MASSVDVGNLSAGNTVTINYTDTATSTPHTITLVRVDDPSALPLSNTATATANDTVFGINFSGGMGSVVTQINAALTGTGMTASNRRERSCKFSMTAPPIPLT